MEEPIVTPGRPVEDIATGDAGEADVIARYSAYVRESIEENRFYPRRARQRRQEGDVTVRFTVTADGVIADIEIVQGSSYPDLDEAARESVLRTGRLEPLPKAFGADLWIFEVPIRFRIE
ncbi:MAG: energy transducer TonB [Gammaproteobacteria bacterium]|nr:energy transducer TonB [Gammaproteobacteria bacterium]